MELCVQFPRWSCLLMFLSATVIAQTTKFSKAAPIASPGCPSQCGNVTVPYPFGIGKGSGCAYDSGFEILCNTETNPPRAFLTIDILPTIVYDISDREIRIPSAGVATHCFNSTGALVRQQYYDSSWILSIQKYCHYSLSPANKLITVGCDDTLMISDGANTTAGCTSRCTGAVQVPDNGTCSGIGCCQSPIPNGLRKDYDVSMVSAWNHTKAWSFNRCGHTFLGEASRFRFLGASDLSDPDFQQRVVDSVPLVLDWAVGNLRCEEAQNSSGYVCQVNSHCVDSETGLGGYRCSCDHGYEGNPYLSPGCTDIDECANPEMNPCEQICINVQGGYNCSCLEGYYGDGKKDGHGCFLMNKKSIFSWLKFSIDGRPHLPTSTVAIVAEARQRLHRQRRGPIPALSLSPSCPAGEVRFDCGRPALQRIDGVSIAAAEARPDCSGIEGVPDGL